MSKTAVIVQARMSSTRLFGKVLMDLNGRTILHHVLHRCHLIKEADVVCCAVPEGNEHDPVAQAATDAGAVVFRGAEQDVLKRYADAARALAVDYVLRITSDCPLIDPALSRKVLAMVQSGGADYACNNLPALWPHGLDCEAFTSEVLFAADRLAKDPYEREHVTPWIRNNTALHRVNILGPGGKMAEQRWTVDFPEDFQFMQAIFAEIGNSAEPPSPQWVFDLVQDKPHIQALNQMHHNISRPKS